MQDAVIDGLVSNLVVNGVEVASYVEAELDRRHPVRLLMRSADPDDLREAERQLRAGWGATVARLRAMDEGLEHQRVGGEWSAVETLRHLVFVHDSWFRRCCLDRRSPSPPSVWRRISCRTRRSRAWIQRQRLTSTRWSRCATSRAPSWRAGWPA